VWPDIDYEDRPDVVREPLRIDGSELAPHTLYAVALYAVTTRIDDHPDVAADSDQLAVLYDEGSVDMLVGPSDFESVDFDRLDMIGLEDDVELPLDGDGDDGIPCTYVRNVLADLMSNNDVVLPLDAIDAVSDRLDDTPVFDNDDIGQ